MPISIDKKITNCIVSPLQYNCVNVDNKTEEFFCKKCVQENKTKNIVYGPYTCNMCAKEFVTRYGFNKHIEYEHNDI
jgi:hypothetical protein